MLEPEATDDALMRCYARGDAAAFEQLYARHQAALYRFVRRLLGTALAAQTDEVFQDTWLRVVHARDRWQPQGATFRTWLFTLAHHRVVDLLRRSDREVALDAFEGDGNEPWQPDAAAWLDDDEPVAPTLQCAGAKRRNPLSPVLAAAAYKPERPAPCPPRWPTTPMTTTP